MGWQWIPVAKPSCHLSIAFEIFLAQWLDLQKDNETMSPKITRMISASNWLHISDKELWQRIASGHFIAYNNLPLPSNYLK